MSYYEDVERERADKRAEGYECRHCGYVPTYKELNLGVCHCTPRALKQKQEEEEEDTQ